MKQRTIKEKVSLSGIGLHTGVESHITFLPANENSGVNFIRVDLPNKPTIKASVDFVTDTMRGTTLSRDNATVHTVEHILSALNGLGIDNITIEIDAEEPPQADGSAKVYVELFQQTGIVEQSAEKKFITLNSPVQFVEKDTQLIAMPIAENEPLTINYTCPIDFKHPFLGAQYLSVKIEPEIYYKEISPARTFCFHYELEMLKKNGLIKGGNLKNAVVIGENELITEEPLRFKDEFVRHKILDLVGDLYLLGNPLRANIIAIKSGHKTNVEFAKKIKFEYEEQKKPKKVPPPPILFDIHAVQEILPHRYPFLLVDRILEMGDNKVVGIKNVTINEEFFLGHFPGRPIMPGVLIIEAMGQVGGILLLKHLDDPKKHLVYFAGLDGVRFRQTITPGDQIRFEVELTQMRGNSCKLKGKAFVLDKLVAEAEMLAMIVDR